MKRAVLAGCQRHVVGLLVETFEEISAQGGVLDGLGPGLGGGWVAVMPLGEDGEGGLGALFGGEGVECAHGPIGIVQGGADEGLGTEVP
ncbi:MAG TPA: hypothetical protein VIY86_14500, partial [Pirellulaceae bacterium]